MQADAIASLPIYKLNKLDYEKMTQESKEDAEKLAYAKKVQSSSDLCREIIIKRHKNELKNLKGKDFERKPEIIDDKNSVSAKLEVPEAKVYFSFNKYHYLHLSDRKFDDALETTNKHRLGFIDENGICYNLFLENEKMTNSADVLVDTLLKTQAPIIGYTQFIDNNDEHDLLYVFTNGHVKLSDIRKFRTKSRYAKVASGKTKRKIAQVFNVPLGVNKVTINDKTFVIDKLSRQGIGGSDKKMIKPIKDGILKVDFETDPDEKSVDPKEAN